MCERSAVSALSMIELRTGLRDFECGSAGVLSARHDQAKTRPCKCGLVQNLQNLVWCGEGGRSRGFMGHSIEGLCPPLVEHCVLLWPLPLSVRASMCAADRGEGHDLVIVLFAIFLPFSTACLPPAEVSVVAVGQQYTGRAPCPREDDALLVPFWLPPPHRQGVPCAGQSVSARFPMSSWDFPGPELLCFPAWRSLRLSEICVVDLWAGGFIEKRVPGANEPSRLERTRKLGAWDTSSADVPLERMQEGLDLDFHKAFEYTMHSCAGS